MHLKKEDAAVRPPDVHSCRFPGDERDTIPAGQKSGVKMAMVEVLVPSGKPIQLQNELETTAF